MTERYKYKESEVLCYDLNKNFSNATVRRYYSRWRAKKGIPEHCDIDGCSLNKNPSQWNGKPIELTLDHKDGHHKNNTPKNLRLLCPNCASQQPTHGGRNINRIQNITEMGYEVAHRDGHRDANVFPKTLYVSKKKKN